MNRYIFLFPIIGTDLVNHAESGDTKSIIRFPKDSDLKFLLRFGNFCLDLDMRVQFLKSLNMLVLLR